MKRGTWALLLVTAGLLVCPASAQAGYIQDREAAMKLWRNDKTEAAIAAFNEIAAGEVSGIQKADALEQAFRCLIRLDRVEAAKKTIERIPIEGVADLCRMRLLSRQEKYQALVDRFADAKIEQWPSLWRASGYALRGEAAHRIGRGELAASDLEQAVVYAATFRNTKNRKAGLLNTLGVVYRDLLKDDQKAIDAFRRTQRTGKRSDGSRATFAIADIYLRQGKSDKAVQVVNDWLAQVPAEDMPNAAWQQSVLFNTVRVLTEAGRNEAAITKCKQALANEKIEPAVKQDLRKRLAELHGKAPEAMQAGDE